MNISFFHKIVNYYYNKTIPIIPKICELLIRLFFNSIVYSKTKIAKNCTFAYGGIATVIHPRTIIWNNILIGQPAIVGGSSRSKKVPLIGNNVYIAVGAKILGAITVGYNSIIGANVVVINDVPKNAVVGGVPSRILKRKNQND